MKLIYLIVPLMTITLASASAQTLVAHYDFTAATTMVADMANSLNGTPADCTPAAGRDGMPNTALKFNGRSSSVTVPADSRLNLPRWTFSTIAWIDSFNTATACQVSKILQHGAQYNSDYYALEINDNNDDPSPAAPFNGCGDTDTAAMRFFGAAAGYPDGPIGAPASTLRTHRWYCLTATYTGDTMTYYVDGVQTFKKRWPDQYNYTGATPLYIGTGPISATDAYWFNGIIDDIRIYDDALSAAQVATLCATPAMPTGAGSINGPAQHIGRPFPNPVAGTICLPVTGVSGSLSVRVKAIDGAQLLYKTWLLTGKEEEVLINSSGLPAGVYLMEISAGGNKEYRRFTKVL